MKRWKKRAVFFSLASAFVLTSLIGCEKMQKKMM